MPADFPKSRTQKLKHLKVYDQLYELIQSGTFPPGSQLPSEADLAEQTQVSRMTLRKALSLLRDDGFLRNVPGVGHFVLAPDMGETDAKPGPPLHPVYAYCTEVPDTTELSFRMEPPTKAITGSFGLYTPPVVIADRWYKRGSVPVAYSLSILPIEQIGAQKIDLNTPDELLEFLEKTCYQLMGSLKRTCSHSTAGNFSSTTYTLSDRDSFLLVLENIYDKNRRIVMQSKHYIPFDRFKIEILFEKESASGR